MATINVVKPFTLTRDDGSQQAFGLGKQDASDADAKHWYVKAHLDASAASTDAELKAKADADQAANDAERKAEAAAAEAAAQAEADAKAAAEAQAKADADAAVKSSSTKK